MRTDDLIHAMVADGHAAPSTIGRRFALAIALGFAVSAAAFWVTLGFRPDIAAAVLTPRFNLKIVQALLLAATAVALVLQLGRPEGDPRLRMALVTAAPILLVVAVMAELFLIPAGRWQESMIGNNSIACLTAIPLLSLPLLAAVLLALRQGAPTRLSLAGAAAGLFAGGLAAALYATQCTDDSPLFVGVWYSIAIGFVAVLGGVLGPRLLRW